MLGVLGYNPFFATAGLAAAAAPCGDRVRALVAAGCGRPLAPPGLGLRRTGRRREQRRRAWTRLTCAPRTPAPAERRERAYSEEKGLDKDAEGTGAKEEDLGKDVEVASVMGEGMVGTSEADAAKQGYCYSKPRYVCNYREKDKRRAKEDLVKAEAECVVLKEKLKARTGAGGNMLDWVYDKFLWHAENGGGYTSVEVENVMVEHMFECLETWAELGVMGVGDGCARSGS